MLRLSCLLFVVLALSEVSGATESRFLAPDFLQESYLKPFNLDAGDRFGFAVAIDGDVVVVGAPYEGSASAGVDGDGSSNGLGLAGAAYVFRRSEGAWQPEAYLKASNPGQFDSFGIAVAVSGDTIVVGANGEASASIGVNGNPFDNTAPQAGAAYVFTHDGFAWSQQAYLKASNTGAGDIFGTRVAIDGDTVVVGARLEASASAGVDGADGDDSMSGAGAAYVFRRSGESWVQEAYLKASDPGAGDFFGDSVAVSGDTVVVGAEYEDGVAGGDGSDNGAEDAGAVYVFEREQETWQQTAYLKGSNTEAGDRFGGVAIDGDTIVVAARFEASASAAVPDDNSEPESGAAYVFVRDNGTWVEQAYLKASNPGAGDWLSQVAIEGDLLIGGAFLESGSSRAVDGPDNDDLPLSGAAYVFARRGTRWHQEAYLKAENADSGDYFGWAIDISGQTALVGAWVEASTAREVDGDAVDNSGLFAGAAYTFLGMTDPDLIFRDGFETRVRRGDG